MKLLYVPYAIQKFSSHELILVIHGYVQRMSKVDLHLQFKNFYRMNIHGYDQRMSKVIHGYDQRMSKVDLHLPGL